MRVTSGAGGSSVSVELALQRGALARAPLLAGLAAAAGGSVDLANDPDVVVHCLAAVHGADASALPLETLAQLCAMRSRSASQSAERVVGACTTAYTGCVAASVSPPAHSRTP